MATATDNPIEQARQVFAVDPKTALDLAIAETEKVKAQAAKAAEEYRAMSELEFDSHGRIVRANMGGLQRLATIYAKSSVVPDHYRNSIPDCFIACQMAFRCKVDPLAYMQNSYIVHGKPGLEAKFALAMLNTSGKIKGRVTYEMSGTIKDGSRKCIARAVVADTGETVEAEVTWQMAKAEGWVDKKGSKWLTIPDVMFAFRAGTWLTRRHFPEVLMGMHTKDELEDMGREVVVRERMTDNTLDALTEQLANMPPRPKEPDAAPADESQDSLPPTLAPATDAEHDNAREAFRNEVREGLKECKTPKDASDMVFRRWGEVKEPWATIVTEEAERRDRELRTKKPAKQSQSSMLPDDGPSMGHYEEGN